ncbi:MAG TPA: HlyD family efflux transporter periplasmic adaptor subunit [Burkholderiales bacterium]|nr:HlyD family efflux transporter periplasmic adaptor subunit [Burkholderiales bacterium]
MIGMSVSISHEQDLRAQAYTIQSLKATITQSEKHIAQITSNYRQQLENERVEADGQYQKLKQDWAKQEHKYSLLELKAPQDGIIKDLSTHTLGTVVQPGTVLMTLVPVKDLMQAEVWVTNLDAGFVKPRQPVKLKFASYPFQKYGMVEGEVLQVSPDASETPRAQSDRKNTGMDDQGPVPSGYRTLVSLKTPYLERDGAKYKISPGMQVSAEINLGDRTILEYLLSPVQKTLHEAGRER